MPERKCCPDCNRTEIYKRRPSHFDTDTPDEDYYCEKCYLNFNDPDTKEIDSSGYRGTVKDLIEADPDDVTG